MSSTESDTEEAITKEEIAGTAEPAGQPAPAPASPSAPPKPRNAFTELMRPKPKAPPAPKPPSTLQKVFKNRDGLGAYLTNPASLPSNVLIYYTDAFVAIHDKYPKSTVHCLLLSRSVEHNLLHPFDAFRDTAFLALVLAEALKLKSIVAKELQRLFGASSVSDAAREAVLRGEVEADELPAGRDWEAEVRVGVHAGPSMNHLHVHVFSREMHSVCLKHRKHYNSFNTPFLIDVADFPLAEDDPRRHPGRKYLDSDFTCWRCKAGFGNRFKALKDHLEQEFNEWKRE